MDLFGFRWGTVLAIALLGVGCSDGDGETNDAGPVDGGADGGPIVVDGGGTPAEPPDGESVCPAGACNYQSGDGCSGATPSCVPVAGAAANEYVPGCAAAGAGTSGSACTEHAECAAGYLCAEQQCHKLCCGGDWSGCPSEDEHCIHNLKIGTSVETAVDTGAMLCFKVNECDALDPGTCTKAGTSCQIVDPTGATACFPEASGGAGEPCPCKGGFLCADLGEEKVCRRLCKAVEGGGEPACDAGEACIHYNDKHPAGVGECVPL